MYEFNVKFFTAKFLGGLKGKPSSLPSGDGEFVRILTDSVFLF